MHYNNLMAATTLGLGGHLAAVCRATLNVKVNVALNSLTRGQSAAVPNPRDAAALPISVCLME